MRVKKDSKRKPKKHEQPRVEKETLTDLTAGKRAVGVRGGAGVHQNRCMNMSN